MPIQVYSSWGYRCSSTTRARRALPQRKATSTSPCSIPMVCTASRYYSAAAQSSCPTISNFSAEAGTHLRRKIHARLPQFVTSSILICSRSQARFQPMIAIGRVKSNHATRVLTLLRYIVFLPMFHSSISCHCCQTRYVELMRMLLQYRHLKLLMRGGRGHDSAGAAGTQPRELALMCPSCPHPGINLPEGWENAPLEMRYFIPFHIKQLF